jgi:hypothetical protein
MTKSKFLKEITKIFSKVIGVLILFGLLFGCTQKKTFDEVVAEELGRNVTHDSLFYGLHFNMTMQDFYDHSYVMNQKEIFFQNNMNVEVIVHYEEEFSAPVDFVFFPDTSFPTIQKVRGHMMFRQWAPFTKKYPASKLQEEIKEKMEEWYLGRDFMKIEHPKGHWPYAYAKVDGNRKITLYRSFDDQKVVVIFENLKTVPQR